MGYFRIPVGRRAGRARRRGRSAGHGWRAGGRAPAVSQEFDDDGGRRPHRRPAGALAMAVPADGVGRGDAAPRDPASGGQGGSRAGRHQGADGRRLRRLAEQEAIRAHAWRPPCRRGS